MEARLNHVKTWPPALKAMLGLQEVVNSSGLEPQLINLCVLRASQINGCAYCIDMHTKDLRAADESEQRLYLLPVWREAPFYSDRERAALAWTEAVTNVSATHVPDEIYQEVRKQLSDEDLVKLTLTIVAINGWNRFGVAFRLPPGHYQPTRRTEARRPG